MAEFTDGEEIKVIAENFELTREDLRHINRRLNYMSDIAPLNSTLHLNFALKNEKYIGSLEVKNIKAQFNSMKEGQEVLDLFKEIEDDIHLLIKDWKKKRFDKPVENKFEVVAMEIDDKN